MFVVMDRFARWRAECDRRRLRAFWKARGFSIQAWLEKDARGDWVVRSDMVGGFPRGVK